MELREGQVYEGMVSVSGEAGPLHRWIIVSPHGRTHAHSIDIPGELHCLSVATVLNSIENGRLKLVDYDPHHPVLELQRAKEAAGIRDAHLGLHGQSMEKMLGLLEEAVHEHLPYAPFAAGEILSLVNDAFYTHDEIEALTARVTALVPEATAAAPAV